MESTEKTIIMIFPAFRTPGAVIPVARREFGGRIQCRARRKALAFGAASAPVPAYLFPLVTTGGTETS